MSGEIKITVIATGFDVERLSAQQNRQSHAGLPSMSNTPQIPSMMRPSMPMQRQEPPIPQPMSEEDIVDEELEVPAFIRRKLK
jgi:hypothetical protein